MRNWIIFTVLLASCSQKQEIAGFSTTTWKEDRNGCKGARVEQVKPLLENREQILGLTEQEIFATLGRPDKNELYRRNQKFYIYYIDPSPDCNPRGSDSARYLSLRLNATGAVNEVFLYNGTN